MGRALRVNGLAGQITVEQDMSETGGVLLRIHRRPASGVVIVLDENASNGKVRGYVVGNAGTPLAEVPCPETAAEWAASACAALASAPSPSPSP